MVENEERLSFKNSEVSMVEFARHRAKELSILTKIVETGGDGTGAGRSRGSNMRTFQQLPRHMRRRAMSHNPKRVPRRLMEIHKKEIEKFPAKTSKRPSRRFRRRPKNLLQEYSRRQRTFIWLETHIWHAKRFKMTPKWNYKLPLYPSDKSWRACFHGSQRAALLQDLSYLCCIELTGTKEILLEKLKELTSTECGLTFASAMSSNGNYECSCVVYKRNSYPYNPICPVTFFWRSTSTAEMAACIWLWCHPSSFNELLSELVAVFSLTTAPQGEKDEHSNNEKIDFLKKKEFKKLAPKLSPFYERTPLYKSESVTLTVLKDTLVRFRIVGQWATAILTQTLLAANLEENDPDNTMWWMKCDENVRELHTQQSQFWNKLNDLPFSSRVPPRAIIGLIVRDPREQLPINRCKFPPTMPDDSESAPPMDQFLNVSDRLNFSPIWDQTVRDEVTFTKKTDAEMNDLRAKNMLPGTPINLGCKSSRIPILVIQQPSNSMSDVDAGWDLIIPAGWAMAFWISLIYRGARAGGYREHRFLAHEFGCPHFPDDYPDSNSGKELEESESKELLEKYLKYPPNKRPNYIKLGVATPFSFPWSRLVNEWSSKMSTESTQMSAISSTDYFVLRDRKVIRLLQQMTSVKERKCVEIPSEKIINLLGITNYSKALVSCRLSITVRGSIAKFALICKPCLDNVDQNSGTGESEVEPLHKDFNKKFRREAKKRKTSSVEPLDAEVREKLLTPFATPDEMINHCSKPIMGFLKDGQFSFSIGKFVGIGFVSLTALVQLLTESKVQNVEPFVFVRLPHSFQYRKASITIF